jgi:hypothetical protein
MHHELGPESAVSEPWASLYTSGLRIMPGALPTLYTSAPSGAMGNIRISGVRMLLPSAALPHPHLGCGLGCEWLG